MGMTKWGKLSVSPSWFHFSPCPETHVSSCVICALDCLFIGFVITTITSSNNYNNKRMPTGQSNKSIGEKQHSGVERLESYDSYSTPRMSNAKQKEKELQKQQKQWAHILTQLYTHPTTLLSSSSPTTMATLVTDIPSKCWDSYRSLVRKHRIKIGVFDELLNRLLFWLPHDDNFGDTEAPWREILYGLLSVNRLAMYCSQQDTMEQQSFGTSLSFPQNNSSSIPATSIRIALSVIHCLMPSLLAVVSSSSSSSSSYSTNVDIPSRMKRQAVMRLRLEQIKFSLRLYLLYSYWKQASASSHGAAVPGILMEGGLFHVNEPDAMSIEELEWIQRRREYIGKRTGIRISKHYSNPTTRSSSKARAIRIKLAELLYILRPLYWATAEARDQPLEAAKSRKHLLVSWIVTFLMDVTSLGLLAADQPRGGGGGGVQQHQQQQTNANPLFTEECLRRRKRLLLYLLRAPIWNQVTAPSLDRTSTILQKIPLLGNFLDTCLWDWILYWKHPYVSEEG